MKNIAVYKWGEKHSDSHFDEADILNDIETGELMKLNYNHMISCNIETEDDDRIFYAYPSDVDVDEEGISIKYAFGIK